MRKVIIYAMGQVFENNKDNIMWEDIVAIADKKVSEIKERNGVLVISPEKIHNFEYDYIAIFSNKHFESICRELIGVYFVSAEKIILWKEVICKEHRPKYEIAKLFQRYIKENRFQNILDVGMNIIPNSILTIEELSSNSNMILDGIRGKEAKENSCLYSYIYSDSADVCKQYDATILSNKAAYEDIEVLKQNTNTFVSHFDNLEEGQLYFDTYFTEGWSLQQMPTVEGILWIAKKRFTTVKDIAIYVVTHKEYGLNEDELYKPLCVGQYFCNRFLSEKDGENISYLNEKINECTALYWIWKNTSHDYVGLNHYRRYFYNNSMKNTGNYLNKEVVSNLLDKYDLILPETHPMSVEMKEIDRLRTTMDIHAFETGYTLIRKAIKSNQPDYLQVFDDVMNSHNIFVCNMFVTKHEVLNAYCEWLFSFLIEVAEEIDVSHYDDYSKRVVGFFAERMWTVWLRKQKLRIKELPYDEI